MKVNFQIKSIKFQDIDEIVKNKNSRSLLKVRFKSRQAIQSSKFERFRKKSISIILQFDQENIQQIETFSRNLSSSYN